VENSEHTDPSEDTNPSIQLDELRPSPPRPVRSPTAWAVDRAAPELARLCAGWALRNRSVEELVGYVTPCGCRPKVLPRDALASRLAPGPGLDALRAIPVRRGRLAVVEVLPEDGDDPRDPREHHIVLPSVVVDPPEGLLEPLSAERRDLLDRCLESRLPVLRPILAKKLFDHHTPDALYVSASHLELGGGFNTVRRDWVHAGDAPLLDAADYEVMPGNLLFIVRPDWIGQKEAAAWIGLEQLGLRLARDSCFEREYMFDQFVP
jgi:hypothetical protein